MGIKKHIPNTLTCLNLASGCVASVMAFEGNLLWALIWIIIAAAFDFCDGFAARLLKAFSPIGKELDSLADVVSFGVAPGFMLFYLLQGMASLVPQGNLAVLLPYFAFIIPVFSGLRLAKFNIDERQTTSFIGLPVPANALFWASVVYSVHRNFEFVSPGILALLLLFALLTSLLMVSEIPMFSLKIKSLHWKGNEFRYILLVCALACLLFFGLFGIAVTIMLYILLSIFNRRK